MVHGAFFPSGGSPCTTLRCDLFSEAVRRAVLDGSMRTLATFTGAMRVRGRDDLQAAFLRDVGGAVCVGGSLIRFRVSQVHHGGQQWQVAIRGGSEVLILSLGCESYQLRYPGGERGTASRRRPDAVFRPRSGYRQFLLHPSIRKWFTV